MVQVLWALVLALVALFIAVGMLYRIAPFKRVTILEYQRGLRYTKGRFVATLPPGQYLTFPKRTLIIPVDIRPEFVTIPGQDVLSSDGVTIKISLAAEIEITDANVALNRSVSYKNAIYLLLQMALREIVGKEKVDDLLLNRAAIGSTLMEITAPKAAKYGVKLRVADIKDIMFPGEMKKAFGQVVKAQKEGQAALEKARGETAALRNLANAAKMIEDNPNLLQLRALQSLADSNGNTLVLGLPNSAVPLAKRPVRPAGADSKLDSED